MDANCATLTARGFPNAGQSLGILDGAAKAQVAVASECLAAYPHARLRVSDNRETTKNQ
jgi:hypothetical protein